MTIVGRRLSLVVPVFNEEEGLPGFVVAARAAGESLIADGLVSEIEILFVDDASTDSSPGACDALAATHEDVRVVHHEHNRGLGGTVRTGLAESTGDLVLYTDADLPFDLFETSRLLRLLWAYDADIVCGWRLDRRAEGWRRSVYSRIYNLTIRVLFGLRMRDVNFACKLMRRRVIEDLDLHSEGSFIDAEIMARASRRGHRIIQTGVDYFARTVGVSTLSSFATIRKIVREMLAQRREIRKLQPMAHAPVKALAT